MQDAAIEVELASKFIIPYENTCENVVVHDRRSKLFNPSFLSGIIWSIRKQTKKGSVARKTRWLLHQVLLRLYILMSSEFMP